VTKERKKTVALKRSPRWAGSFHRADHSLSSLSHSQGPAKKSDLRERGQERKPKNGERGETRREFGEKKDGEREITWMRC